MAILSDATQEAARIIAEAQRQGLTLRLLGGIAVRLHSPSAAHRALARAYPDLDFALAEKRGDQVESLLTGLGYRPNRTFNLLNGDRRLLFFDEEHGRQVDVFVGGFHMCHSIPFATRLPIEPITLPLAELLLTKLQIVQMNEKDVRDIAALLLDHPLGDLDEDTINLRRVSELSADDWGLWKTVGLSLEKVAAQTLAFDLEPAARQTIVDRILSLRRAMEETPKTMRWKLRARVGERILWYDLPEEVQRT